jgi:phosphoglycolate phosphatase-like HAD superfamily hydrolase
VRRAACPARLACLARAYARARVLIPVRASATAGLHPQRLLGEIGALSHIVFDLDGTLYDTRDFERPALAAVALWLRQHSGKSLEGFAQALWTRRETDRHRVGLFDELLREYGLPSSWGAECAARFHSYPGEELLSACSLREELGTLRRSGRRLALVTNGRAALQQRKLRLLGLEEMFDLRVYCDPAKSAQLKPSTWAWGQLQSWRGATPAGYVGDDPVDAQFAAAGAVRYIGFAFRNARYGN